MSDTRGEDDVAEFKTFFTKVLECFEKMEMKYVIVGGLAAILRGRARTTSDIDIIVEGKPELVMILLDNMERNGLVVMKEQARLAISEGTNISVLDRASYARVDLKVARNEDENEALKTAVNEAYEKFIIKVATIEEILYGKLLYMGPLDDLTDKEILNYTDAVDFLVLYALYKERLDRATLMRKIRRSHLEASFKRLTEFKRG